MDAVATDRYVIVGGGLAGAKAAETLRDEGHAGPIVLLADEDRPPYERPPLSKGYLTGEAELADAYVHPADWYADHDIELRLGATATALDRDTRNVVLADGERIPYTKALLATGASPRVPDLPGAGYASVHYLRRMGDAEALLDTLKAGGRLAIVGAGWIGLEVAAAARGRGVDVTMVEPQPSPLNAILGDEIGGFFADVHRAEGVDLRLGTGVAEISGGGGRATGVVTADGERIGADAVLVAIGAVPNTGLAEAAGLAVDNGVVTDERFATADPDVYAAGDVAAVYKPLYGAHVRVEHWANALDGGPAAARAMLGREPGMDELPFFFSDQYDLGLEYAGWFPRGGYDRVVVRGDTGGRHFYAFWLGGGRVLAGMHVNEWDEGIAPVQDLIRSRTEVDADRLADPGTAFAQV